MIFGLLCTLVLVAGFTGALAEIISQKRLPPERRHNGPRPPKICPEDTVADAKTLAFTAEEIEQILRKLFPYYNTLNTHQQQRFVGRVLRFIRHKIFIIKTPAGYREMPVLASAAAVQLTFGLDGFLLPWFRYIQIHPQEFFSNHSLRVLAGNVSARTVTVAWNHLLHGYAHSTDGSNVALHEMAHALYVQKLEIEKEDAGRFCYRYRRVMEHCRPALKEELSGRFDVYTDYGESNLQEFWAESIELFFERSTDLKKTYPALYASLCDLLNQDPLTKEKVLYPPAMIIFQQVVNAVRNRQWHRLRR